MSSVDPWPAALAVVDLLPTVVVDNVHLLPALLIAIPILAATLPVALGLWTDRTGWSVAAVTTTALFAAAVALAAVVFTDGQVGHALGGYDRTYGIELVADEFSTPFVVLVTAVAGGVLAYTRRGGPRGNTFYAAYLLLTGGLLGISLTGDVFNLFVFLEISSLATYALVASGDGPESAVAALKYLVLGTMGASFYLLGVAFLFMATGTLNMAELAIALPGVERPVLLRAAFGFVFVGFALKVAQWPLHTWQPDAYQHAPDGVTPLIAALVSTVSAYALGRVMYTVFGPEFLASTPYLTTIVVTVGSVSVLAGSSLAVIQRDVKRMFAFSSVSQFGLVVAAYGLVSETAFVGATIHLLGHGLMKAGLFTAAGLVAVSYGARTVDEYAGLARARPVAAAAMGLLLIALVGIPPAVGFVGKWYIAVGAVGAERWPVAVVVFLSTMLTLAYAARLLEKMYFTPAAPLGAPQPGETVATDGGDVLDSDDDVNGRGGDARSDEPGENPDDEPGENPDSGDGGSLATSGGTARGRPDAVSAGMLALLVVAALGAVALGFAGGTFFDLLEPFLSEVFN